ncbi:MULTISPECIES: hypothetical protein [Thalassospira]|jgi:hypothetical protein|uniref:YIP1 family protein n=1 Tax=Thalassospira lohafexi TaxID=744227 RepID=A0A2N3L764_9PROT|nr:MULTISPECIES: hypothetical protein [Thalassospira]MBV17029.1 hypothetical protein [Thalassospira sp.]PKR58674.1 hypothetical protein COO92_07305 [Thalassospira lohafexi]|tara:strand:- start:100 stop:675 length:576 start_codon:yes stop_codon:yes gene_type:complete
MNMSSETLRALYGTWRIARGDANGLTFFDFSLNGFWRSFLAAIIVFPAFAFLRWHDLLDAPEDFPVGRYMTVEVVAYVIKWLAFPVLMYQVMPILGRTERYIGFITVYNWSSVLQMAVYLVALLLGVLFPMLGPGGFVMVAVIAMLVYGVYIARLTLSVPIPTASAIVMADFLLSMVITSIGIRLALGQLF